MFRPIVHLLLHVAVPGLAARLVFRDRWQSAWAIMLLTMLVDLDHFLATPVYEPSRCSIGFHPLHSYFAIAVYTVVTVVPKLRIIGVGLLIHMGLDFLDCLWMHFE